MLGPHETLGERVVEKLEQRRVEAGHVEETVRLAMKPELAPRPDLGELLERAEPAGQRHERVGHLGEPCLPLVHRGYDVEPGEPAVRHFPLDEVARHDADDLPTRRQRAIGERAHEPRVAAAIYRVPAGVCEELAERTRGLGVARVDAKAGGAEDADGGEHAEKVRCGARHRRTWYDGGSDHSGAIPFYAVRSA